MKILVIKPSSLGDIVHGLQVMQSVREQLGEVTVDWVVNERFREMVEKCELVDRVYGYKRGAGLCAYWTLLMELRQESYDYVLDFQGLLRSGVMLGFSRGRIKIGRGDAREGAWLFYYKDAAMPEGGKHSHAVDVLLNFLPEMGLRRELKGEVKFDVPAIGEVDSRLKEGEKPIVFIPNSRQKEKEWWGFEGLAERILGEFKGERIVWDSHLKGDVGGELAGDKRFIDTSGSTGVGDMLGLVAGAKLVIANDSGPMHLAAAMGVPVVGVFGPTSKERFGPYPEGNGRNYVVEAPGGDLGKLDVDEVYKVVAKLLG